MFAAVEKEIAALKHQDLADNQCVYVPSFCMCCFLVSVLGIEHLVLVLLRLV